MKIINTETINDDARKQQNVELEKSNANKLLETIHSDIKKTKDSIQNSSDDTRELVTNLIQVISSSIEKTTLVNSKESEKIYSSILDGKTATNDVEKTIKKLNTELVKSVNDISKTIAKNKTVIDTSALESKLDKVIQVLEKIKDKKLETKIFGGGGGGIPSSVMRITGSGQALATVGETALYTERYDLDDANINYYGIAPVGTAENANNWTITKYDLTDANSSSGKVATSISWLNRESVEYI